MADLTADTFVAVITGFGSFDPRKGTARSWVFGIARNVYASHCAAYSQQQHKLQRLAGRRDLDHDQVGELLERIDAERTGRGLIAGLAALPERDRAVIVTVKAKGIPAGDILVVGVATTTQGSTVTSAGGAALTSPPASACVSLPSAPAPGAAG